MGGNGCGIQGLAGAYADVYKDVCFIHWATKCRVGEAYMDYFWRPQCNNWMEELKPTLTRATEKEAAKELEDSCI